MGTLPGEADEGRLDLVPMIDCIMLLLLFFMMTTKFTPGEKGIDTLLSTNDGCGGVPTHRDPPQVVHIRLYPVGLSHDAQLGRYEAEWQRMQDTPAAFASAALQIGGREPLVVDGTQLGKRNGVVTEEMKRQVETIHAYIAAELAQYEKPGAAGRQDQAAIEVDCFSGLPWKFALVTFDAVRSYEHVASHEGGTEAGWMDAATTRAIGFAPPRLRDGTRHDLGDELYEIIHQR